MEKIYIEESIATCGCISHDECCICFEPVCNGKLDKTICDECNLKLNETNDKGQIIHPINRKPITICNCGKPGNPECTRLGLFGNFYEIDIERLDKCKTPEERRNLARDPTAMIKIDGSKHFPIKQ